MSTASNGPGAPAPANIPALLLDWQQRLTAIGRNLMELAEQDEARMIKARRQDPLRPWQGLTKRGADRAVQAMDGLWQDYLLLSGVVADAAALVAKNRLFANHDTEILALLEGPSVTLPSVAVPLGARDLLSGADRADRARPAEILAAMQQQFRAARDGLAEIGAALKDVRPRQARLAAQHEALRRDAALLVGEAGTDLPALPDLSGFDLDPLGAVAALAAAEAELAAASEKLAALRRAHDAVMILRDQAQAALPLLHAAIAAAAAALDHARAHLTRPPLPPAALAEDAAKLAEWLVTLDHTARGPRWKAAGIGLGKWHAERQRLSAAAQWLIAACQGQLAQRHELIGRFTAQKAKADALALRGHAPTPALRQAEAAIAARLAETPMDMAEAHRLLAVYEAALLAIRQNR